MKKRTLALLMAVVMLFGVTVGGTIAWLKADADKVENTFTFGKIDIVLDETDTDESETDKTVDGRDKKNAYKLIPGAPAVKDPIVTVSSTSEKCYVFVKLVEEKNSVTITVGNNSVTVPQIIEYEVNTTYWKQVESDSDIYVYTGGTTEAVEVDSTYDTDNSREGIQTIAVLKPKYGDSQDKHIKVSNDLTEAMIEQIGTSTPVLTFDACAVQSENNTYETALGIAEESLATVN